MGIFDKLGDAQTFGTNKFFEEGSYTVELQAVKMIEGHKGTSFIIEAKVIETDSGLKPGTICSQVQNMDGEKRSMGLSTVKEFLSAVLGDDSNGFTNPDWAAAAEAAVGEDQPLVGIQMKLNVFQKPTKAGRMFTHHKWLGRA